MSRVRLWVVALTGVSFLAGGAAGVLLSLELMPPPQPRGAFADYGDLLVREYDLDESRAYGLRVILERYQQEIERVKSRHMAAMEPELVAVGRDYEGKIRDYVLPEDQRQRFDREAAGRLATSDLGS